MNADILFDALEQIDPGVKTCGSAGSPRRPASARLWDF